jgi:hypothetical protein
MRLLPGGLGFFFDAVNYQRPTGAIVGNILGTFRIFEFNKSKAEQFSTFLERTQSAPGDRLTIPEILRAFPLKHCPSQFQLLALRREVDGTRVAARAICFLSHEKKEPQIISFPLSFFLYNAARQSDKKGIKSDSRGTKRRGSVTKMGPW